MKNQTSWPRCVAALTVLIASVFLSNCEYAIRVDANGRLVRAMDVPKALNTIRAGFTATDHQLGCNQYLFFHKVDPKGWRNDSGIPERVSMTGNIVEFYVDLRDHGDSTPLTSEPTEVSLDVTKIDHLIEWTRPSRDIAREGHLIEIDFDNGWEEITASRFAHAGARPTTQHTLYCGIAKESVGIFLAAIRYLNPGAAFIAAR